MLLVDDDPIGRMVVARMLQRLGYTTQEAGTAEEALELLSDSVPAAVVADVRLPGMDGLELAAAIRADERLAGLRLLMLSGLADDEAAEASVAAGADDHLAKPVGLAGLEQAMTRLLA